MFALSDADHPQELVDVIARVTNRSTKDDKDVVDIGDGVQRIRSGSYLARARVPVQEGAIRRMRIMRPTIRSNLATEVKILPIVFQWFT